MTAPFGVLESLGKGLQKGVPLLIHYFATEHFLARISGSRVCWWSVCNTSYLTSRSLVRVPQIYAGSLVLFTWSKYCMWTTTKPHSDRESIDEDGNAGFSLTYEAVSELKEELRFGHGGIRRGCGKMARSRKFKVWETITGQYLWHKLAQHGVYLLFSGYKRLWRWISPHGAIPTKKGLWQSICQNVSLAPQTHNMDL